MRFTGLFAIVVLAASAVVNAKVEISNPRITAPSLGAVWTVGSKQTVTWEGFGTPPSSADDNVGYLVLGTLDGNSEDLDFNNPLATQVSIDAGAVVVTVPDVADGDNYVVALITNSANLSPEFSITH